MPIEQSSPSLTRTIEGWKVELRFNNQTFARYYHYKKDAVAFMNELTATIERYGSMFHPEMLHMYKEERND